MQTTAKSSISVNPLRPALRSEVVITKKDFVISPHQSIDEESTAIKY